MYPRINNITVITAYSATINDNSFIGQLQNKLTSGVDANCPSRLQQK